MKKSIILNILITLLVISTVSANEMKYGLGWYSSSAPVGGRIWFNSNYGLDLGLGYADKNFLGSDKDRFHLNIGLPVNVFKTNSVNFFIRPGFELQTNARTVGADLKSKIIITADLGAEWWITENFTLSVGHGLQFEQLSHPSDDSKWGITALRALSFNNVGFHFYFN
ncbi:MAG: hypothetical protein IGBAC_0496 [Ignavibacteriae bacterium]|nr:MAG: hypothetical protein IGBAC_0496 [Ignavibacteriota bacterium]